MLRVSDETRRRIQQIGQEEFGGATADETVRRLIDEHWRATAVAAVHEYRAAHPHSWQEYLTEADDLAAADAPIGEDWSGSDR